jgi:hypothetical protein
LGIPRLSAIGEHLAARAQRRAPHLRGDPWHVGHKSGVAGVYNKAQYLDEKRRALERWAKFITENPADKIVPLRA